MEIDNSLKRRFAAVCIWWAGLLVPGASADATVLEFTNKGLWEQAAGEYNTIHFNEIQGGGFVTDQYSYLGVIFTDGNDWIGTNNTFFPNDGYGIQGSLPGHLDGVTLEFTPGRFSIAVEYPGSMFFELYSQGQLIYTSSQFGGVGVGFFAGLVSTEPFDSAVLIDWDDNTIGIDDLHFGVPGPGALPLLVLAALTPRRRRRA